MQVSELQTVLKQQGMYGGQIDNAMGPATIAAIIQYQKAHNLKADGQVGPATLAELVSLTPAAYIPRRASASCQLVITSFEGVEDGNPKTVLLDPYIAPEGNATIAWGHLITDSSGRAFNVSYWGTPEKTLAAARDAVMKLFGTDTAAISRDQGVQLLAMDINTRSAQMTKLLINHSEKPLNQTSDDEFDALLEFDFNLGQGTLERSTLLRLHEANHETVNMQSIIDLKATSIGALEPTTIPDAFCAYSRMNHVWTLGLFRRRYVDAAMYAGLNVPAAIKTAMAFH